MKVPKNVAKSIKKHKRFLITSHMNPEGDSLGSQLAVAGLLKCMGKQFAIVDHDKVPPHYMFLPGAHLVKQKIKSGQSGFDAAIVLDCPNLKRTGRVKTLVEKIETVINIDHHVSNERFGDVNWVDKDASSVGEMIYKMFKNIGCSITREAALYIYIAILTDTGSFNYSNTSRATHEIVSELLARGIEPYDISKSIYENKSAEDLKLLGTALSGLEITEKGKVAYMSVRKKVFAETGTKPAACENFVNFARSVRGVEVAAFFREDLKKKNYFNVSLRSGGKIDVNTIASYFGGGGHRTASGFTIRGSFGEVKRKVLKKIRHELR